MNSALLEDCSDRFKEKATKLEEVLDNPEAFKPQLSPAFYVLNRLGSDLVERYIEKWPEDDWYPTELSVEYPSSVGYLVDLHRSHPDSFEASAEGINRIMSEIRNGQHASGLLQNYHTETLLTLVKFGEYEDPIVIGIDYLKEEILVQPRQGELLRELPCAILALLNLDHMEHQETILEMGTLLHEEVKEALDRARTSSLRESSTILAFEKIPWEDYESVSELEDLLWSRIDGEWDYDFDDSPVFWGLLGESMIAMLAVGHGPKIPQSRSDWKEKLENQKHKRSQPVFVSTLPTTRLETRRHEIYETAKEMIENASSSLRISSQFIDMLHDEIIDLIEVGDVDVRILARRDVPTKGERSKMKEAVMQELIRRGKGENVRGDRLLHSRLIITDEDRLMVTSADLTRDQLYDEYNAGLQTRDPETVEDAIDFFDTIWKEATSLDIKDI